MPEFKIKEDRIEYMGQDIIIYDISDLLPQHKNYPRGAFDILKPNGKPAVKGSYWFNDDFELDKLYVHQTAGSIRSKGFDAVINTASFFIRDPKWNEAGKWIGNGRGWPGFAYTYFIPFEPEIYQGKVVIFRCNLPGMVTWHSSDNKNNEAIVCQGYFKSRHIKKFKPSKGTDGEPSELQIVALTEFIEYKKMQHPDLKVLGHCDSPKPKITCPGDVLEKLIGGEINIPDKTHVDIAAELPLLLPLDKWKDRQAALKIFGYDLGSYGKYKNGVDGVFGSKTRLAIEALEDEWGLIRNGYWDSMFDVVIRIVLLSKGVTQQDIEKAKIT